MRFDSLEDASKQLFTGISVLLYKQEKLHKCIDLTYRIKQYPDENNVKMEVNF